MAGIYEIGRRAMTESKVAADELDGVLEELAGHKLAFYVEGVLWVVARVKRLRTKTIWVAKSIAKDVADISPAHPLRRKWLEHHRNASWLASALAEARLNLTSTSSEPHINADTEPNRETLTRTSPEVPLTGLGRSTTSDEGHGRLTREIVDDAITILSARWTTIEEAAIENAAAMYPEVDLLQGARLAVTWASDPSWTTESCAASLRAAMNKLDGERPKVDEKASRRKRRGDAMQSLLEGAA